MNRFILKLRILLLQNKVYYILFFFSLFYSLIFTNYIKFNTKLKSTENNFYMRIDSYKLDGNKLSLELSNKEKLIGNYYFKTLEEKTHFVNNYNVGDIINVRGELKKPKNNTIPNTFNYKEYLYNKKIFYTLKIKDFKIFKKNNNIFYKIKNFVYKKIYKIENNSYIYALLLGDSTFIEEDNFRINGVSHLFALSGLHVSLIAMIILKIIKIFKKDCEEKMKVYIAIFLFLLLFSFITGFKPSFLRAIILFILIGINKAYYFNIKGENLLIITFFIMTLLNPFFIKDVSFQLSLTITYFLFFSNDMFKSNKYVLNLLWASIISLVSSLPIIINNFYSINFLGIINNLFFVPFISFIIYPLSLLAFIFPFLNKILLFLTNILEFISSFLASIKTFTLYFPKMNMIVVIVYYIFIIHWIKTIKKLRYVIFITIMMTFVYIYPLFNKKNVLYFLDVSQGDSAIIKTKNNKTIMIDTGGILEYEIENWKKRKKEFDLMKSNIIPFFNSIGIKKIDYLFLSHADEDHSGNVFSLVKDFDVKMIMINKGSVNKLEKELNYKIVEKYYEIDGIKIYSLNDKIYNNENENSLILLVIISDKKILFLGDASFKQEEYIINKYNLKDIFILKVGHHGSKNSTGEKLMKQTTPSYSVISVGENNRFGHPSDKVINILDKYDSCILRTDKKGTIKFEFDKKRVDIIFYLPY